MKGIKDIFSDVSKKLKADKKLLCIVLVGIVGMVIILLTEIGSKPESSQYDDSQVSVNQKESVNEYTYVQEIEQRLTNIVSSIDGAGRAKVMVTLANGAEQVYAKQDKTKSNSSIQGTGEGRSVEDNLEKENEYLVIRSNDNSENGLIIKIIQPDIRGVAIVCEGADSIIVKQSIINTVTAVLGISSTKVNIAKMADQNTED
ncbi:MAG TPA: hypothetical protein VFD52_08585 [Clostridia bacterium]|nr:hypothetical protein [Clostridia bacterium]